MGWIAAAVLAAVLLCVAVPGAPALAIAGGLDCGPRGAMVAVLARRYGEHRVASGVSQHGRMLEVFASETGETWTVLLTHANGTSCLVFSGEAWRFQDRDIGTRASRTPPRVGQGPEPDER